MKTVGINLLHRVESPHLKIMQGVNEYFHKLFSLTAFAVFGASKQLQKLSENKTNKFIVRILSNFKFNIRKNTNASMFRLQ